MSSSTRQRKMSLPRGWNQSVRSAVLQVISLAHDASTRVGGQAAVSLSPFVRLKADNQRLRQTVALLQEEVRIKDARMALLPPQRRPHYPSIERMAILELRAARGWSLAQKARTFLVTPLTITQWLRRMDEQGSHALVQLREPVNKFPEFVGYLVAAPEDSLSHAGQEEDRRNTRASRSTPGNYDRGTDAQTTTAAESRAARQAQQAAHRHSQMAQPCVARGLDRRTDDGRLLDHLVALCLAAVLALLLVGGRDRRSLCAA